MSSSTDQVVVGSILRPHGVRGDVVVLVMSDHPDRFEVGSRFSTDDEGFESLTVIRARQRSREELVLGFDEVADRTGAEELRGVSLTIDAADRRPLADGEYWPDQLIGLGVVDTAGEVLGRVVDVEIGVQDRLVIEARDGSRVQVPFVDELVPEVAPDRGRVVVDPVEGLFS